MTERRLYTPQGFSRRSFLKRTGAAAAGLAAAGALPAWAGAAAQDTTELKALVPAAPDPTPPGVPNAAYSQATNDAFAAWQAANGVKVAYEDVPWPQLHDRMAANFASGVHTHDVIYMSGWVPEFADFLVPFVDQLPAGLVADLPPSSFSTVTWDGQKLGVVFTLSLLTTFYNKAMFDAEGITAPPRDWAELLGIAEQLTKDGKYGWVLNYGETAGIGGVATYWFAFLQQAGGRLWDESGQPDFDNPSGVDSVQMMIDLMKFTDPGAITYVGINDATNVFTNGTAAMMLNWPFMWVPANGPDSPIAGQVGAAINPAGPAGTASIDGTDAYTITKTSANPELARQLIEFYLDPAVQKSQSIDTGWLPIRLSVLNDPEVQEKSANAKVVLEQAQHPYDSFITPDYNEVTIAISTELQKALQGQQDAATTVKNASEAVKAIVARRG
jgi:ABC-type glycerol-3-phosphate transport system substrate-binding protein